MEKEDGQRHSLSSVDAEARTGICSVCGPVHAYKKSKNWACGTRVSARAAKYHLKTYPSTKKVKQAQVKRNRLWVLYHLTPEDQTMIETFQREHPVYKLLLGNLMGTDHCHKTGLIRGRLDWRINRAYGLLEKVDPENTSAILRALAEFHDNPPATLALKEKRYGLIGVAKYKRKMVYGSENGPLPIEKKVRK